MDVVVKVVLDQKEYDRLIEIERKYGELSREQSSSAQKHTGDGLPLCSCKTKTTVPLSQVIVENTEAHALKQPIPGILPSITTSREDEGRIALRTPISGEGMTSSATPTSDSAIGFYDGKQMYPWYYIGTKTKSTKSTAS